MSKIAVCAMFKDSVMWHGTRINHVERFFNQILSQDFEGGLDIYVLEGDSKDNTYEELQKYPCTILKRDIGTDRVASDGNPNKYVELSKLGNDLLHTVRCKYSKVFWIESDLIVHNTSLISSLAKSIDDKVVAVAPLVWIQNARFKKQDKNYRTRKYLNNLPTVFYDGWGFVGANCEGFGFLTPPQIYMRGLMPMCSVGSCVMLNNEFLTTHSLDYGYNGCLKGLNKSIVEHGGQVWLDTNLYVLHPGDQVKEDRWI